MFCLDAHVMLHLCEFCLEVLHSWQGHVELLIGSFDDGSVFEVAVAAFFGEGYQRDAFLLHHRDELLVSYLFSLVVAEHGVIELVTNKATNNCHGYLPVMVGVAAFRVTQLLESFIHFFLNCL